MTPVQENLLTLLKEIDEICKKHNIIYYLAGGTALGAVRNAGFLPWDDDIDIYITRDNWKKFESIIDEELKPDREIACVERNDLYRNPIPRYIDKNTTSIYRSQALAGVACGQHIEFLIMDPVPTDPIKEKEFKELLLIYTELLTSYFVVNRQIVNKDSSFNYKKYKYYLRLEKLLGRERVLSILEDKLFRYEDNDDCEFYCLRWGLKLLMYERRNFGTPRYMPFEDGVFPVGSRAESIFRRAYGDTWMIIPQPQEQVVHTRIDNLSISYENYISDFHQFIDINESLKKFYEYKQYNVKALESVETNIVNRHKLNSIRHKIRIENNLKNKKTDLKMMLKNRDYDKLNDIFEDYYQHQLDSNFMKWDIYIDINDEYLYIALMLLIIQGEYFNALKILKLRERESILSRELSVVKELALAVRELSILIYDENNYIEAETLLKKWFNLFPDILDFKRHNLLLSIYFAKDKNEFNQIKKNAYKYLEQNKNDGELLKFLGDVYFSLNDRENAINVYLDAILITRNGILLEQIYTNLNELSVDMDTVKAYIKDRDEECERDTEEIT